jgi:polyisoprenoid-binding protein YceI
MPSHFISWYFYTSFEVVMKFFSVSGRKLLPPLLILIALPFPSAWPEEAAKKASDMRHYKIDPQDSRFFVTTGSSGLLSAFGHNHKIAIPGFTGEVDFDPRAPERASLSIRIDAASLFVVTGKKKEEKDKPKIEETMRTKVLEVETFPQITFRSTEISATPQGDGQYDVSLRGDLTLHGVTRSVPLNAKVALEKDRLTAHGEFTVKQTDFQIQPVSAAGGTVKVKDEIRLSFEMEARP